MKNKELRILESTRVLEEKLGRKNTNQVSTAQLEYASLLIFPITKKLLICA